jgi:hypothetical protein
MDATFSNPLIQRVPACDGSLHDMQQGTYVSLTYTDQKNATRGEALGHGLSGDLVLCPVLATHHRALHLREHGASPTCPLYHYYDSTNRSYDVTTREITFALRHTATAIFHLTNIPPDHIKAYSLCSGGATALLVSGINEMAIHALGHWKSDAIFLYLRTQPSRLTSSYASSMLSHGQYTFSPSATNYDDKDLLPHEATDSLATTLYAVDR